MIYYIFLLIAVVGISLQFTATKQYQRIIGAGLETSLLFTGLSALFTVIIFFTANGFRIEFTPFSYIIGFAGSAVCLMCFFLGFKVMESGRMSFYMLYLMLGGMILPYLYGIALLNEKFSIARIVGIILLVIALFLSSVDPNEGKAKNKKHLIILCVLIFLCNGSYSILSKVHQVEENFETVSAVGYVIVVNLFNFLISLVIFIFIKLFRKKGKAPVSSGMKKLPPVSVLLMLANAALGGGSYYLQLNSAANVDASVMYPMITGGTILLSALTARIFFKEKPTRNGIIGLIIMFVATMLFLI